MLALSEDGDYYRVRHKCEETYIEDGVVYGKWRPWDNVEIKTWLVAIRAWQVRVHHIKTGRNLMTAEGGFAMRRDKGMLSQEVQKQTIENRYAVTKCPWGLSGIVNLYGDRKAELVSTDPNTNIIHSSSSYIPTILGHINPGEYVLVTAVYAHPNLRHGEKKWLEIPSVKIDDSCVYLYMNNQLNDCKVIDIKECH